MNPDPPSLEDAVVLEDVGCPLCDRRVPDVCWREKGYSGRRCEECGVIYVSPRPDEASMARLYSSGHAGGETSEEHVAPSAVKERDARYALRFIRRFRRAGRLLEIGAGGGHFLREARAAGFQPSALELEPRQADFIRRVLDVETFTGSAADPAAFEGRRFDVIFHRDLLSHLHDPLAAFRNLRRLLDPGGVMVFETGNGGDLTDRWLRFLRRLSYPEHVALFGERSLEQLLERSGFRLLACRRHSHLPWITLLKLAGKLPRLRQNGATVVDSGGKGATPLAGSRTPRRRALRGWLVHALRYRWSRFGGRRWPATLLCAVAPVSPRSDPGRVSRSINLRN